MGYMRNRRPHHSCQAAGEVTASTDPSAPVVQDEEVGRVLQTFLIIQWAAVSACLSRANNAWQHCIVCVVFITCLNVFRDAVKFCTFFLRRECDFLKHLLWIHTSTWKKNTRIVLFFKTGFPVQSWEPWNSLCRPGQSQTQRSTCFVL